MSTFLIDVPTEQAGESVAFWSAALGVETEAEDGQPQYTVLKDALPGFVTAIQAVDDQPRYHFDIETDDVAAEVARLEALGAVEVSSWQGGHTLRAPGGHLVCVIPVHTTPEYFAGRAKTWP
ncbi:VOC family protein [Kribbella sp. CA-293567]|uniref:VOC family protein n=1 Tax=Kribbella sp. CA-293567 TaxID=3002436 RepID=UPI0022DDEFEA|nr:VOC family protein [Kribbella sp. CA-293567]WBQ02310.1 VOC family protein [Kribbella sp. CA-293567]